MTHLDSMKEECRGLNECMLETHNCHEHAICTNSIDSFECTCNDGFSGNGTICEDKDECSTGGNFLWFISYESSGGRHEHLNIDFRRGMSRVHRMLWYHWRIWMQDWQFILDEKISDMSHTIWVIWYYVCPYVFVRCKEGFKVLETQCVDVDECRDECASRSQASFQPNSDGCFGLLAGSWTFLAIVYQFAFKTD